MEEKLIKRLVCRTAELSIGPSTVRNQGDKGVVKAARTALKDIRLDRFAKFGSARFEEILDNETEKLRRKLPSKAQHWGTARKCLNIFLRDVLYNQFLSNHFGFWRLEAMLELPLDSYSAKGLKRDALGLNSLPCWRTIKSLTPGTSRIYQDAARHVAMKDRTYAVHLDLKYWRAK